MAQIYKLDKQTMRKNNVRLIFETIYKQRDRDITRAQLAAQTKMSAMNVGRIVDQLLDQGLVVEHGDTDSGAPGRPAKRLALSRSNILALGVSLDVWGASIGLVDPYGKIIAVENHAFDVTALTPEAALQKTGGIILEFMKEQDIYADRIGVVMPGLVDPKKGHVRLSSQLCWRDLPVSSLLKKYTGIGEVLLDNDVKARALAESRCGSACNYNNSVLMVIGSGIGAGVIINGSIYRGKDNMAGEIGHIAINTNTKLCECGQIGCLQATVTEPAILQEARTIRPDIDMNGFMALYKEGEAWARRLMDMACGTIVMTINLLANTFASEAIILCGSLIDNYPAVRGLIDEAYAIRQPGFLNTNFDLCYSSFNSDGNVIGAASIALQSFIRQLA
ncbi:ROK family protein [Christensenellaceae bacterium OttesenSCG-928-M15]|nr:ROK family protein [Christensenellaceae bacterium OttesenSCG-928-M15]